MVKNFDQTSGIKRFVLVPSAHPPDAHTHTAVQNTAAAPLPVDMSALSKASPLKRKPAESSKSPSKPKTALEPGNQPTPFGFASTLKTAPREDPFRAVPIVPAELGISVVKAL